MRHTVLHAVLNHQEPVILLLDTGAAHPVDSRYNSAFRNQSGAQCTQELYSNAWKPGGGSAHPTGLPGSGEAAVEDLQVGVFTAPTCSLHRWAAGGTFETLHAATRLCTESAAADPARHARHVVAHRDLAPATVLSTMPTEVLDNHMLVQAMLNHTGPVTLLLDTGITYTMLTSETAWRAGLQPIGLWRVGLLKVVRGQQMRFPLVPIAALAMGRASSEPAGGYPGCLPGNTPRRWQGNRIKFVPRFLAGGCDPSLPASVWQRNLPSQRSLSQQIQRQLSHKRQDSVRFLPCASGCYPLPLPHPTPNAPDFQSPSGCE